MSRSSVRKQMLITALQDDSLPTNNQKIVQVLKSRGNNLHEVKTSEGSVILVSMPKKFRGSVWVKSGGFVLVEPIEEGNKVKAEIVKILNVDQIKYYKMNNAWPEEFFVNTEDTKPTDGNFDADLLVNPNRVVLSDSDSDTDSNSDEEDSDDEHSDDEHEFSKLSDSVNKSK